MNSYNGFTPYQRMQGDRVVKEAIAAGAWDFIRICQLCGLREEDGAYIWVHQEDYSRPLEDARPICVECHMRLHMRFRFPNMWQAYCLKLRARHKPAAWKSNAAFIAAHPIFGMSDGAPVKFEPDASRWWEMLSVIKR